ncbi:hypothetical protein LTR56_024269 [Elasticomyces elasticus]|nr:hypothetical protein LTR56_024269 [Elasticomyces elasticus]KAK3641121.1 hypothetical protein LTR22_016676 [Elasticomyces elasticus]KAK4905964.1 hypothetical protein LTR49_024818 [Elasticomyces elasticus]KAK5743550.1 hypothetical protein LTS12_023832 [Elasticomyces elasticus]
MEDTLVVGIDFGTTFSGVAAAYSANPESPDELHIIKTSVHWHVLSWASGRTLTDNRWPGGNNITSDKVPTEVAYGGHHTAASTSRTSGASLHGKRKFSAISGEQEKSKDGQMRWGLQIKPDEDRLRYLKLFLDPNQNIPDHMTLSDVRHQLMACGKNVPTIVAEYLGAVFAHTKVILGRRYGQDFVAATKLRVVLTVPAVWTDAAKDATFRAAEAAGMGDALAMISEPEAAAVYTLQAMQPNHLKIGHNFIVIDAGGGTVDLISYSINQLKPLRLEELAKGSGGFCGAAFLNVRFEQFVRTKLGKTAFTAICSSKPKSWLMALKYFEDYVKRNFDADEDDTFNIPFPGVEDNEKAGIEGGFLVMDTADVETIFRPVITDIISLVEGQIALLQGSGLEVHGLVLVGGFGQSECLLKSLQTRFSGGVRGIEVLQPVNAWTAVVRGAVLRGLEGAELVMSRKARRHYGVTCCRVFDARVHPHSCRIWDPLTERWMADDRMRWFIKKGDTVSSTDPVLFSFTHTFTANNTKTITEELIICDADEAPEGYSDAAASRTRIGCTMVVNLDSVPKKHWETSRNSRGQVYQRLHYTIGMQIESGGLRFEVLVDDVSFGKVKAEFS